MQGSVNDLFNALIMAPGLRILDLHDNPGLQGPLVPADSGSDGALCVLVRNGLRNLRATGMQLGLLPGCMLDGSSQLSRVYLGAQHACMPFMPSSALLSLLACPA